VGGGGGVRSNTHLTPTNNKAKCIPGGTLRVLAGKNSIISLSRI
jgi:hypothetical protein